MTCFLTSAFFQDLDPTFSGTRECKFLAVKFKLLFFLRNCGVAYIKYVNFVFLFT